MKLLFPILIFGTSLVVLGACKKDKTVEDEVYECSYGNVFTPEISGEVISEGIIPFGTENYWVYADTTWTSDSTYSETGIDTVSAIFPRLTNDDLWMGIEGSWPIRNVHQEAGNVYSLQTGYNGCKFKSLAFYEAGTDTIEDSGLVSGDMVFPRKVFKNTATISTPAGDFDNCTQFQHLFSNAYQLLKPGIGIVKFVENEFNGGYTEHTLVTYHIE